MGAKAEICPSCAHAQPEYPTPTIFNFSKLLQIQSQLGLRERINVWQSGGRGFDPHQLHQKIQLPTDCAFCVQTVPEIVPMKESKRLPASKRSNTTVTAATAILEASNRSCEWFRLSWVTRQTVTSQETADPVSIRVKHEKVTEAS